MKQITFFILTIIFVSCCKEIPPYINFTVPNETLIDTFYMDDIVLKKGMMVGNKSVIFYGQTVHENSTMGYCTCLPDTLDIEGKFYGSPAMELSK